MNVVLITTSSFAAYDDAPLKMLKDSGFKWVLNPYGRKLNEDEVVALIDEHHPVGIVAGVEPLTRKAMLKGVGLRIISRCGIGLDSVDLAAAGEMSVVVTNTPEAPTRSVAELALGLILSLLRKIILSDVSIRKGEWKRPMGTLLTGKTVGLVGCGRIGSCLGEMLDSMGCTVLGYDPFVTPNLPVCQCSSLSELLQRSDIVSLHLPYSKTTHNLLGEDQLDIMKRGAFLINVARGGLVDEIALYNSLKNGRLAGAALDCFALEPYNGKLKELDNVVLTGHIGSYAVESRIMMETQAVENLLRELENTIR